jgi:hypothetical protein
MRFELNWSEPTGFRHGLEPTRAQFSLFPRFLLAVVLLALLVLAVLWLFGELFLPPVAVLIGHAAAMVVLCLSGIPLVIWFGTATTPLQIDVGPKGISCTQSIATEDGPVVEWAATWDRIAELFYAPEYPLGERVERALVVVTTDGKRKAIGLADDVTRARLAATCKGWGKRLEDASGADYGFQPGNVWGSDS